MGSGMKVGYIFGCDIVEWTTGTTRKQRQQGEVLQRLLHEACAVVGGRKHLEPTGDGAFVIWHAAKSPRRAVRLAIWMHKRAPRLGFRLRMALHQGLVEYYRNAKGQWTVSGATSDCDRLLGFCPPGEIVASRQFRDLVKDLSRKFRSIFGGPLRRRLGKHRKAYSFVVLRLGAA